MGLNQELTIVKYEYNSGTDTYAYDFTATLDVYIRVLIGDGELVAKDRVLIQGTEYTVSRNPDDMGGTITLVSLPIPDFEVVTIQRIVPYEQPVSYTRFYKDLTSEGGSDNVVLQTQQLKDLINETEGFVGELEATVAPPNEQGRIPELAENEKAKFQGSPLLNTGTTIVSSAQIDVPTLKLNQSVLRSTMTPDLEFAFGGASEGQILSIETEAGLKRVVAIDNQEQVPIPKPDEGSPDDVLTVNETGDAYELKPARGDIPIPQEEDKILVSTSSGTYELRDPEDGLPPIVVGDLDKQLEVVDDATGEVDWVARLHVPDLSTGEDNDVLTIVDKDSGIFEWVQPSGGLPTVELGDTGKQLEVVDDSTGDVEWVFRDHVPEVPTNSVGYVLAITSNSTFDWVEPVLPDLGTPTQDDVVFYNGNSAGWGQPRWATPVPTIQDNGKVVAVNQLGDYVLSDIEVQPPIDPPPTEVADIEWLVGDFITTVNESRFYLDGDEYRLISTDQTLIPYRGQVIDLARYPELVDVLGLEGGLNVEVVFSVPERVTDIRIATGTPDVRIAIGNQQYVYVSTNGGVEFSQLRFQLGIYLCCGVSSDGISMVIAGNEGLLRASNDFGRTWRVIASQVSFALTCMDYDSDLSTIYFGTSDGRVVEMIDFDFLGARVIEIDEAFDLNINSIAWNEAEGLLVVCGQGGFVAESSDAGFNTWTVVPSAGVITGRSAPETRSDGVKSFDMNPTRSGQGNLIQAGFVGVLSTEETYVHLDKIVGDFSSETITDDTDTLVISAGEDIVYSIRDEGGESVILKSSDRTYPTNVVQRIDTPEVIIGTTATPNMLFIDTNTGIERYKNNV